MDSFAIRRVSLCGVVSLILLIAAGCSSNEIDYDQLTEQEKRSAEYALAGLSTTNGLQTTLFAAEDMLVNPTNMDIDAEGRVWVTEGFNYRLTSGFGGNEDADRREDGDRIVILEDTNGDGRADTSKVFYQGNDINAALGIMVLDGRVIVSRSPHVFVFYDEDGDDVADRKEVMFSGIQGEDHDHGMHAFVFGPDGKFYFNFGNSGGMLGDAGGNTIMDEFGNPITDEGDPYRQGMVFRSDRDVSNVEVLGHNFRNNYEVAVDSYGTLWQSDNDDDGNQAVRINYVMEYGNYGYAQELTGADWDESRIGMAEDIPTRHWHQNDPGVIPNLLQTGSGSPSGILLYEGDLLPEVFRNEMIHAEPGHNVVRSYPVEKDGAGYTAEIENILQSAGDQWFRPSDVTVAPDGSIFVADWYDPGVGGHSVRDQYSGRIFRVAPADTPYRVPEFDLSTPAGAVEALQSPNMNLRARAWLRLHEWGTESEEELVGLWGSDNPRYRARALWLLSKLPGDGIDYIDQALSDPNSDIRITGLRAARQLDIDIIPILEELVDDSSPQVRREVAIALHQNTSSDTADIWVQLALQHDGNDRWYLEALGIGAAGQWDQFFGAWLEAVGSDWNTSAGRDIVWRSRAEAALPLLADILLDPSVDIEEKPRYYRAMQFNNDPDYTDQIVRVLQGNTTSQQDQLDIMALTVLGPSDLQGNPVLQEKLDNALEAASGTQRLVDLVGNYELEDQNEELFMLVISNPDNSLGSNAAELLLEYGGESYIHSILEGSDEQQKRDVISVLINTSGSEPGNILEPFALNPQNELSLRQLAIQGVSSNRLVELYRNGVLPEPLHEYAGQSLLTHWRTGIREVGNEMLGQGQATQSPVLAPVSELASMEGDPENGMEMFEQSCQICHVVNGEGTEYGPALSQIGSKLSKEALYDAILNPSNGINFGYEGYILTLTDGTEVGGIIGSETETEVELVLPGGFTTTYSHSEISSREQMQQSLMPEGLHESMSQQELVDLVEYLSTLE